jgi:hypothetical protein
VCVLTATALLPRISRRHTLHSSQSSRRIALARYTSRIVLRLKLLNESVA